MTSKEFVIWLKGFVAAANEYNVTPKQFEQIVEQLSKVSDNPSISYGTNTSTFTGELYGVSNTKVLLKD